MRILFLSLIISFIACQPSSQLVSQQTPDFTTPFEQKENYTATYSEIIDFYKKLDANFQDFTLVDVGKTDIGKPLHLGILSKGGATSPQTIREEGKVILLINNAIHAGEPTGVDASMMLVRDILTNADKKDFLNDITILVVPCYNVGGVINRNSHTRTNQNGPTAYGFRGNAKNLDLNRDFIKADSENAKSFNQLFQQWQPQVFIDNHTSNGADYQYTMTIIPTQHNKLHPTLAKYQQERMLPYLFQEMKAADWEMTPYVYARTTPDKGIAGFLDLPRYSSGYASLFNTLSFMPEAHMLKPYKDRVAATYTLNLAIVKLMLEDKIQLITNHKAVNAATATQSTFDLNWSLDMTEQDSVLFKGYEAKYKPSEITGKDRLYYDHDAPFEQYIPFFNTYKTTLSVEKPIAYIIPQSYTEVINRLKWNGVTLKQLKGDQQIAVDNYFITDYKSRTSPYEGHYLHYNVSVATRSLNRQFYDGDYVVYTNQPQNRYIVETLEPQAPDSYFAWNFFDGILQQKEYFSAYVFEDLAAELLNNDKALQQKLAAKKEEDEKFANSPYQQLDFIYKHSPHYESTHNRYPVARLIKAAVLSFY